MKVMNAVITAEHSQKSQEDVWALAASVCPASDWDLHLIFSGPYHDSAR